MIDVNNESGVEVNEQSLIQLAGFVLKELRIHPRVDLSILLVDEETMTHYHQKFMGLAGPTDVMSFPMDELRVPAPGKPLAEGMLGDVVLCPTVAAEQAGGHGRSTEAEMDYLLVHGLLHLLGYDHAQPAEAQTMFALNDSLTTTWAEMSR